MLFKFPDPIHYDDVRWTDGRRILPSTLTPYSDVAALHTVDGYSASRYIWQPRATVRDALPHVGRSTFDVFRTNEFIFVKRYTDTSGFVVRFDYEVWLGWAITKFSDYAYDGARMYVCQSLLNCYSFEVKTKADLAAEALLNDFINERMKDV